MSHPNTTSTVLNESSARLTHLHAGETNADHKVGHPVDQHRNSHGTGPGSLGEELCGNHPGYRTGSHRKEDDESESGHHREVGHPVDHFLHITKELLYKMHSTRILDVGFSSTRA